MARIFLCWDVAFWCSSSSTLPHAITDGKQQMVTRKVAPQYAVCVVLAASYDALGFAAALHTNII